MTVKVFISGLSGNKEVKKRQQRVLMILDSKNIDYSIIDITEPGKENEKEFMQQNSKPANSDSTIKSNPLPPQIFNEEDYCGNYEEFDLANEMDELEKFLKLPLGSLGTSSPGNVISNGTSASRETSTDKELPANDQTDRLTT
uniref:SH3 domain-binding glutamic acid-rich protein homolog n=1 Tax=Cacopsylla melanoneura TaxID=428564 RepID=A0A8D9A8K2_9HEMI